MEKISGITGKPNILTWGCSHEEHARSVYQEKMNKKLTNFGGTNSGLIINPRYPNLGATNNGVVYRTC